MAYKLFLASALIAVVLCNCVSSQLVHRLDQRRPAEITSKFNFITQATREYVDSIATNVGRDSAIAKFTGEAWSLMRIGDINRAIIRFNRVLCLDTSNANPFWGYGLILSAQCQPDSAIYYLRKAVSLDSSNVRLICDFSYAKAVKVSAILDSSTRAKEFNDILLIYGRYQPDFAGAPQINCQYAEVLASNLDFTKSLAQLRVAKSKGVDTQNSAKIVEFIKSGGVLFSYICK